MKKKEKAVVKIMILLVVFLAVFFIAFEPVILELSSNELEGVVFNKIINSYIFPVWLYVVIAFSSGFIIRWIYDLLNSLDRMESTEKQIKGD